MLHSLAKQWNAFYLAVAEGCQFLGSFNTMPIYYCPGTSFSFLSFFFKKVQTLKVIILLGIHAFIRNVNQLKVLSYANLFQGPFAFLLSKRALDWSYYQISRGFIST